MTVGAKVMGPPRGHCFVWAALGLDLQSAGELGWHEVEDS